jgi:hypothetical protein
MPADHSDPTEDEQDRLQHALRTPLSIIWGRVQLMERRLSHSSTLSATERDDALRNLAAITTAIEAQRRTIDGDASRRLP